MRIEDYTLIADYHTHTVYSHGKGSVRDNVNKARELGLKRIAITDHGSKHFIFGVSEKKLLQQIDEIHALRLEYVDIDILSGVECNLCGMSGKIDISNDLAGQLDIVLCGFHKPVWSTAFGDLFKLFYNAYSHYLYKPTKAQIARNTSAYINLIKNNKIDILTHPNYHLKLDVAQILQACYDYGTVFELSTRHDDLEDSELELLAKSPCMIAINSDAHKVDNIANVNKAIGVLAKYDILPTRVVNCKENMEYVFRSKNN